MRRAPVVAAIVAAVAGALVLLFAFSPKGERAEAAPRVGKLAPEVAAETTAGDDFDLDELRGSWVLVNFFATWCAPCKTELPELEDFARSNAPNASVVAIAFDKKESTEVIDRFFGGTADLWPVIVAGGSSFAIDWGVIKLPESYLVAPNGKVALKVNGGVRAADLESYIARAEGR